MVAVRASVRVTWAQCKVVSARRVRSTRIERRRRCRAGARHAHGRSTGTAPRRHLRRTPAALLPPARLGPCQAQRAGAHAQRQTEGRGGKFTGVMNCVTQTVTKEGFTGLYEGMAAPLVLTGTARRGAVPAAAPPDLAEYLAARPLAGRLCREARGARQTYRCSGAWLPPVLGARPAGAARTSPDAPTPTRGRGTAHERRTPTPRPC